jgi:hypothetical protein
LILSSKKGKKKSLMPFPVLLLFPLISAFYNTDEKHNLDAFLFKFSQAATHNGAVLQNSIKRKRIFHKL